MLCARKKAKDIRPEEKWDFISLQDFKSSSFFEFLAYGYLWCSLVISIAVYGVDTFTAYNLIALGKFTGIEPEISLDVSKWIFTGCIIASWVNVIYEHIRAHLIIRRGAVAESYLDSLAVRLQAVRVFGQGRGWKRFLVFSELTKSKKGAEYVALFTYFSFQSWIRVIFCSGPRQVINAFTLKSVYVTALDPKDADAAQSILQFFENIGILADQDKKQAVILSGMLFTLVIWIFAALSLLLAMCFYLLFLWHYIPNGDGGLSGYCERKINGRLQKIVSVKINKAIEEEERKRVKGSHKGLKNGEKPTLGRQATLPTLFDTKDDKLPSMPMLGRNDTTTTLPAYSSRPGTPSSQLPKVPDFELSNMDQKRPLGPSRLNTATSAGSYAASSGLVANAADMGYSRTGSPAPPMPGQDGGSNGIPFPAPQRTLTGTTNASQGSNWQQQQQQQYVPQQLRTGTPSRQETQDSYGNDMGMRNGNGNGNGNAGFGPPARQMTQDSYNSYNAPQRNMTPFDRVGSPMDRSVGNTPFDRVGSPMDRSMGNTPLARIASPMDRSMGNTPITRTDSPLSYTSRPGPSYTPAPSNLSQEQYAPPSRQNTHQNHDSYDPYSTASVRRVTQDSSSSMPVDDEPTLPSFDAPTIVGTRGDTSSSHYAPSIASSRGGGGGDSYRAGPPPTGQNAQTRYGRSTPSQGSIESSVGRRTPGIASPVAGFAQPARSASAGVGQQQQGYGRAPPGRNMTEPGGGYNAYGGGGGGGGYRQ